MVALVVSHSVLVVPALEDHLARNTIAASFDFWHVFSLPLGNVFGNVVVMLHNVTPTYKLDGGPADTIDYKYACNGLFIVQRRCTE